MTAQPKKRQTGTDIEVEEIPTGGALAPYRSESSGDRGEVSPRPAAWFPTGGEIESMLLFATKIADTEFVPATLRKRPAAVLACIAAGREMGVGPMQSLQQIHVIQGRPAPSAQLMRSLVLSAGHQLCVTEYSEQSVTIVGRRRGEVIEHRVTFDLDDAKRAGLLGKDGGMYTKYPRAMLLARATSELCRTIFPDVLAGFSYTPEEVQELPPLVVDSQPVETSEPAAPPSVDEIMERLRKLMHAKGFDGWTIEEYVGPVLELETEEEQREMLKGLWKAVKNGEVLPSAETLEPVTE